MRRLKAEICYISSTGRVPTNEELALATTRLCAVLITLGGVFTLPGTVADKVEPSGCLFLIFEGILYHWVANCRSIFWFSSWQKLNFSAQIGREKDILGVPKLKKSWLCSYDTVPLAFHDCTRFIFKSRLSIKCDVQLFEYATIKF